MRVSAASVSTSASPALQGETGACYTCGVAKKVSSNSATFSRRPWTSRELKELRRLAHLGAEECARRLGRTASSVKLAAHRHLISLRTSDERRGLLLGQPRSYRVPAEQREALLGGGNYDKLLAAYSNLMRGKGELCPGCGKRPVTTRDGFCTVCHARRLADMAAQRADEAEERLRRWRESREAG